MAIAGVARSPGEGHAADVPVESVSPGCRGACHDVDIRVRQHGRNLEDDVRWQIVPACLGAC